MGPTNPFEPADPDTAVEQLAATQFGVMSVEQVTALGMTPSQIRARVDRRSWQRLAPGVLGFPGHADSLRRSCWIALLHAGDGSMLSHSTAGLLWRMRPLEHGPVDVMVPRGHSRGLPGTRRHRPRNLGAARCQQVDGLPVTDPARTVVDLAATLRPGRLADVVEHCEVERICTLAAVGAELARLRHRGVPGVVRLETVLDELGTGEEVPRSELERIGDRVRRLAGLPEPEHEHPLPSARGRPGFVDRAWPGALLLVEYDGRRWHTRRSQIDRDHRRDLEASALGWHPLRLTWEQLSGDPETTAELWRATYLARLALVG